MARQIARHDEAERRRLFDEVQQMFAEHEPVVYFVAPRIYVAHVVARHATSCPPSSRPQLLWAAGHAVRRCATTMTRRTLPAPPAPGLRPVPGVRRVVGVAGARAAGAGRLRRPSRSASRRSQRDGRAGSARGTASTSPIGAQYRRLAGAGGPARLRPLAAVRRGRSATWSPSARPTRRCWRVTALVLATLIGLAARRGHRQPTRRCCCRRPFAPSRWCCSRCRRF